MGAHRQEYIHNVASSIAGQIHLTYAGSEKSDWYQCEDEDFPQEIWKHYGAQIMGILGKMGPAARGRIAACGLNSDNSFGNVRWGEVNRGSGIDGCLDGNAALTLLASYVIIAAMVDTCRAQVRRSREEEMEQEHMLDRAMTHAPSNVRARGSEIPDSSEYPPSRR